MSTKPLQTSSINNNIIPNISIIAYDNNSKGNSTFSSSSSSRNGTINIRYTVSKTTESECLVSSSDFKTSMSIRDLCEEFGGFYDKERKCYALPYAKYIAIAEALQRLSYQINLINKPNECENRTEQTKERLKELQEDSDILNACVEIKDIRRRQIHSAAAEVLKSADLSKLNTKDLAKKCLQSELADLFALYSFDAAMSSATTTTTTSSSITNILKQEVKQEVRLFVERFIEHCEDDDERKQLTADLTENWKYEKAVAYVLKNETDLETDGAKIVSKRVLKRLNEEDKYHELSKMVKEIVIAQVSEREKINLEKKMLSKNNNNNNKDELEKTLHERAKVALERLTEFKDALEEREEHAAEMAKVAAESKKKRKANRIEIEKAPEMFAEDVNAQFAGGYVGSGNASMSIGIGGYR